MYTSSSRALRAAPLSAIVARSCSARGALDSHDLITAERDKAFVSELISMPSLLR